MIAVQMENLFADSSINAGVPAEKTKEKRGDCPHVYPYIGTAPA